MPTRLGAEQLQARRPVLYAHMEKPRLRGERAGCLRISCLACYGPGLIRVQSGACIVRQAQGSDRAGVHPSWHGPIGAGGDARRSRSPQCPLGKPDMGIEAQSARGARLLSARPSGHISGLASPMLRVSGAMREICGDLQERHRAIRSVPAEAPSKQPRIPRAASSRRASGHRQGAAISCAGTAADYPEFNQAVVQ